MTLGEKIASARKEKGMTQEMLAEQLGVTRQAVARWETGKALPGTANLFMLRQLLGIPLEAADREATDLEGTTGTEKSGTLANTEKAESLTAKQKWMQLAAAAILLWFALQFVGLGAAVGLLLLLLILRQHRTIPALRLKHRSGSCRTSLAVSALRIMRYCPNYCALFDSDREKRYCGGCKINRQKNVVSDSGNAAGTRSMERCFCGISKLPKQGHLEYAAGGMAELPRGCRMDAALRNNGK